MKDLFQLQAELIDTKVNMAVSNAIDRVIDQIRSLETKMHFEINSLRNDMNTEIHDLRNDMNTRFSSLEQRVTAVETKLGMVNDTQREIRTKLIDYSFKAGWLMLGAILSYLLVNFTA